MKKLFILMGISTYIFATTPEVVHSSLYTFYENKKFDNSKQKDTGNVYGIGIDLHNGLSEYKLVYENAYTKTFNPPLAENLKVNKLFLRYKYNLNKKIALNLNYINVLDDNIAQTDDGIAYGIGVESSMNKQTTIHLNQFYTNYRNFNIYQTDLTFDFKMKLNQDIKMKLTSLTKYIKIDEKRFNSFTKNSKSSYLISGIKLHSHYKSYHFGIGAYLGKRAFAIMNDGLKIQHHAMEFKNTYAIGFGKTIGRFVVRCRYIHQKATELPMQNKNVKIENISTTVNYKF